MRHHKLKLMALLILGIGLSNLQAQNRVHVIENAGTQTSFELSHITKLSFSGGNVNIHKSDGVIETFDMNHIRSLSFVDLLTNIPLPETQGENNSTLYPNPATDQLQITLSLKENCNVQVDIIDILGRTVLQQKIFANGGVITTTIQLSQLTKGLYICRLQSGGKTESIKFIKNQ